MGAPNCVMVYGIRYGVGPEETDALERRADPRQRIAGLHHYWDDVSGNGDYILLVGTIVGTFGPEDDLSSALEFEKLRSLAANTESLLKAAGLEGKVQLHVQWFEDF